MKRLGRFLTKQEGTDTNNSDCHQPQLFQLQCQFEQHLQNHLYLTPRESPHTADQAQYLFQTSNEKELITWIDAINYDVAMFSSPQLPSACSSSSFQRFQRPLMPSSKSNFSLQDQLVGHEQQLLQLRCQIEQHLQNPPHLSWTVYGTAGNQSGIQLQNFKAEQEFLWFEIKRYKTYILTSRTRNALEQNSSSRC